MNDKYWVICETDHYQKSGSPQHFFLKNLKDGSQIDPLGYSIKYKVKSYRLFKAKGDQMCENCEKIRQEYENKIYHGARELVHKCRNVILGRSGHADERDVEADARHILASNGDKFNLPGYAQKILEYYNSPEAMEYRNKQCATYSNDCKEKINKIKNIIGGL